MEVVNQPVLKLRYSKLDIIFYMQEKKQTNAGGFKISNKTPHKRKTGAGEND